MNSLYVKLPKRKTDDYGSGEFGAKRGERIHQGIDYACYPGTEILCICVGKVTKLGYPYADGIGGVQDDIPYRYVEVTDGQDNRHRYFYVEPMVMEGSVVTPGTVLGYVQNLQRRYGGNENRKPITNHVHYEVIGWNGTYLDPDDPRIGPKPADTGSGGEAA